jgi:hypothetical protein
VLPRYTLALVLGILICLDIPTKEKGMSKGCGQAACPSLVPEWDPHPLCWSHRSCTPAFKCSSFCSKLSDDQLVELERSHLKGLRPKAAKQKKHKKDSKLRVGQSSDHANRSGEMGGEANRAPARDPNTLDSPTGDASVLESKAVASAGQTRDGSVPATATGTASESVFTHDG